MLNKVTLIGLLGRDPETTATSAGLKIVSFSMATSERWKDKTSGERKERTEWHNIVIFNDGIGSIAEQYLKKGSKCYIEGQLQTREWEDRDGNKKRSTEIVLAQYRGALVLLGDKGGSRSRDMAAEDKAALAPGTRAADIIDDDIPFSLVLALLLPIGMLVQHVI